MKNALGVNFFVILFVALFYQPAVVCGDTIFFDFDGNVVDKAQYEQNTSDRENNLSLILKYGYDMPSNASKDPVKLRKKRIEQWRVMRSDYHPESLPSKIETPSTENP